MPRVDPILIPLQGGEVSVNHSHIPSVDPARPGQVRISVSAYTRQGNAYMEFTEAQAQLLHTWLGSVLNGKDQTTLDVTAQIARNPA